VAKPESSTVQNGDPISGAIMRITNRHLIQGLCQRVRSVDRPNNGCFISPATE
jgi:hypothetical protein